MNAPEPLYLESPRRSPVATVVMAVVSVAVLAVYLVIHLATYFGYTLVPNDDSLTPILQAGAMVMGFLAIGRLRSEMVPPPAFPRIPASVVVAGTPKWVVRFMYGSAIYVGAWIAYLMVSKHGRCVSRGGDWLIVGKGFADHVSRTACELHDARQLRGWSAGWLYFALWAAIVLAVRRPPPPAKDGR